LPQGLNVDPLDLNSLGLLSPGTQCGDSFLSCDPVGMQGCSCGASGFVDGGPLCPCPPHAPYAPWPPPPPTNPPNRKICLDRYVDEVKECWKIPDPYKRDQCEGTAQYNLEQCLDKLP
jgi:hypothetical protein